jgi:membrane protein
VFAQFRLPIGWAELLKRTYREFFDDNCLGLAAQLAFYFFLALFPALLFLVSLIGFLEVKNAFAALLSGLGAIAPGQVLEIVRAEFEELSNKGHGGLLTLGFLGALWSSSAAMVAIIDTLNHAYDIEERRAWWKTRLLAIALTVTLAVFIVISVGLILAGPWLAVRLDARFGFGGLPGLIWTFLQWPVIFLLVVFAIDLIYYFAPNVDTEWAWVTPGSLIATLLWIACSLGFKVYVTNFGSYNATYGAIGGVIVLLLWFYLSGISILIGAEINAEIYHALPAPQGADYSATPPSITT